MTEAGEDSLEQTLQCVTGGVTVQGGEGEWEGMRATLELGVGYDAHVLRLHWFSSTGTPSESWEKQLVAAAPDHSSDDEPNPEQVAENQEKTQLLEQFRAEQQQQQQQQESFIIPASVSLSGKDCLHEFKGELLVDCLHEFKAELLVDEMMDDWVSPSPLSGISLCISLPL
jgi:hypothetical protein